MWDTVAIGHITDPIHVKKQGIDMSWYLDGNDRHTNQPRTQTNRQTDRQT